MTRDTGKSLQHESDQSRTKCVSVSGFGGAAGDTGTPGQGEDKKEVEIVEIHTMVLDINGLRR